MDCVQCVYCCGYRRETHFGGVAYEDGTEIPVDKDDVCIHLEKIDNGFARCKIHDRKPKVCRLFYCLTEQKVRQLQTIVNELKAKCE